MRGIKLDAIAKAGGRGGGQVRVGANGRCVGGCVGGMGRWGFVHTRSGAITSPRPSKYKLNEDSAINH